MTTLAELLAKEGFKRDRLKQGYGGLPATRTSSLPAYSSNNRTNSMEYRARRNRSRSDAISRRSHSILSSESRQDRGKDLRRSMLQRRSVDGYRRDSLETGSFDVESYSESQETEESNERYHVSYPNSIEEELGEEEVSQEEENLYTEGFQKTDSYEWRYSNELYEAQKVERNADNVERQPVYELKMDKIAVKAIISIVTGYIRCFFKDEKLRSSLYQNCASCLFAGGEYKNDHTEDGVINNLKQAIRVVEDAGKGSPSPQELKRAALQLSVITGLSSEELKDGVSFGIPNLHLAACAHVYLGVICKFQKKDKASAKHLLQIFSICPNQARTTLLPGLWHRLFSPHLSHLKEWYDHETEVIARSASRMRKIKLLEEVYNDLLDEGTHQFGVYYREWLVEGAEAPELPSTVAPRVAYTETPTEVSRALGSDEFPSPGSSASTQATVSRKLYESVFRQSRKKIEVQVMVVEEIGVEEINYPTESSESLSQGAKRIGADRTYVEGEHLQEELYDSSADDIPTSEVSNQVHFLNFLHIPIRRIYINIEFCYKT